MSYRDVPLPLIKACWSQSPNTINLKINRKSSYISKRCLKNYEKDMEFPRRVNLPDGEM